MAPQSLPTGHRTIVVDGIFFQMQQTGIARLWENLLTRWAGTPFGERILLVDRGSSAPRIPGIRTVEHPRYDYANFDADRMAMQEICDRERASFFVSTYYTTPISTPSVFYAYDMIPEFAGVLDPSKSPWPEKHFAIRHASAHVAISRSTADDLIRFHPAADGRVGIAHCGVDPVAFHPETPGNVDKFRRDTGMDRPYFLYVGSKLHYKNAILFLDSFSRLPDRDDLGIVFSGGETLDMNELSRFTGKARILQARLDDSQLRAAYTGAEALVHPSLYEGFGLPILEAMACGCPVVACRNSSVPEVAGNAAILVDTPSPERFRDAMILARSPEMRSRLVASGIEQSSKFRWETMAEIVRTAFESAEATFASKPEAATSVDAVLASSNAMLVANDWDGASKLLAEASIEHRGDRRILEALLWIRVHSCDLTGEMRTAMDLVSEFPSDATAMVALSRAFLHRGQAERAIDVCRQAFLIDPNLRDALDLAEMLSPETNPSGTSVRTDAIEGSHRDGITVIVYGRNDSHGQNLQKRAVTSLNALAEQLEPGRDEILFTDCNSENDVSTFPETVADLLSQRAIGLIRVVRLRPALYGSLRGRSDAKVLEALSRNVAIRRADPSRRWILSTNTDVVISTPAGTRLTDIVANLDDGLYGAPRFDIPQALWERLDRCDGKGAIDTIGNWADDFGLRIAVETEYPFIRWDNPGDFQLAPLQEILRIGGFDETMLDGPYHIDSNMGRRLSLKYGNVRSLQGKLEVFHLDHSRQAMARLKNEVLNDWNSKVMKLTQPEIGSEQPGWGAQGHDLEELRLADKTCPSPAFRNSIRRDETVFVLPQADHSLDHGTDVPLDRILPFLIDHLSETPPAWTISLVGPNGDLAAKLSSIRTDLGHTGQFLFLDTSRPLDSNPLSPENVSEKSQIVVFDPGTRNGPIHRERFAEAMIRFGAHQTRVPNESRSKVMALMAHSSWSGNLVRTLFDLNFAPTDTWILHGTTKDSVPNLQVTPNPHAPENGAKRLRVGFDGRTFSVPDSIVRGIGHYALYHLVALLKERPDSDITVLHDDDAPVQTDVRARTEALGAKWAAWSSRSSKDFDIFHTPDPMYVVPGYASPFQRFWTTRITATFHDVIPLRVYPGRIENWPGYLARLDEIKACKATLLCNSEFTRKDLVEATGIDPARTRAVLAGFNRSTSDKIWSDAQARAVLDRLGITKPFFLHVGAIDPHKNFDSALAVCQFVSKNRSAQLVVVGKLAHSLEDFKQQIAETGVQDVIFTDFLPREELEMLYSRAIATVFLSRYEGFGFPALEAMAAGCPLVCSNATSLPEVVGDAALLHAPDDLPSIAKSLLNLIDSPSLRQELIAKGKIQFKKFEWADVARRTWSAWEELDRNSPAVVDSTPPSPAQVQWISPIWDPSGYADESRGFVKHLARTELGVSIRGVSRHSETFRQGVPSQDRTSIDALFGRELVANSPVVLDMPGSGFGRVPGNRYHIGRTMFETDSLPADWVARCNNMDEIWVPTEFNQKTFREAGVTRPVFVMPAGIDTDRFRPGLEPLPVAGPSRKTTFLAVFEWTHRKAPDLILESWAKAFGADDDVRLVLRTYPPNVIEGDPVVWVEERITEILRGIGRERSSCAPILILASQVPDAEMPRLYNAADVYLAPSRGEGWGRPHMESMSCGVPVIATGWSGNLAFQTDDNSWLVRNEGLEAIDGREEFQVYAGQRWAKPSLGHLTELLREAANQPTRRKALGERARRDMVELWDWNRIAPLAENRLREILHGISVERGRIAPTETRAETTAATATRAPAFLALSSRLKGRIPIAMPAYSRHDYLVQVLSGLKENTHLDKFYIVTGEEPGCPQTRELFDGVDWMPIVRTINRERMGCNGNVTSTIDRAFEMHDRAVILEDDVVPARDFLAFSCWGLERFEHDPRIFNLAAYKRQKEMPPMAAIGEARLAGWFTPWGWASWRDRWTSFRRELAIPPDSKDSWDFYVVKWMTEIVGMFEVHPTLSRTQNVGEVGTYVPSAEWHQQNHRTPVWFPDAGHAPLEPSEFSLEMERGLDVRELARTSVRWCGQLFNYSGYARLAREAVAGLMDARVNVTADPLLNDKNWFLGLKSSHDRDRWRTLLSRTPEPGVLIGCDIPRDASGRNELFEQIAQANPGCTARVGWTMFETDRIPNGWAQTLNKLDEVWVPSEFNRETFSRAGVDPDKIQVIPGSIDAGPYLVATPMPLPGRKAVVTYLSVFQWVRRKGWDILLKGWAAAFKPSDDVRLVLRCHPFGETGLSMRDIFHRSLSELGLRESDMAPILLLEEFVSESDMPGLYAACDIFVLPSRGEGWGLPYLEAMAAGKPCIATAWGASLEFINHDNSWLLDPRKPIKVGEAACKENPYLDADHEWADPDPLELAKLFHHTATTRDDYVRKSSRSRSNAVSLWSPRTTAAAIGRRLLALRSKSKPGVAPSPVAAPLGNVGQGRLSDALAKVASGLMASRQSRARVAGPTDTTGFAVAQPKSRAAQEPEGRKLSICWEGSQFIHHSLAHVNRELCLGLSNRGHDLSLVPFESDQFDPSGDPRLAPLARLVNVSLAKPCDVHVRHQWPPNLVAPPEGKWVVVQPWEFGSPPKDWIPAFSNQVDELWAYTNHVRQMYLDAGVPPEIVKVVPLGVDCDVFRPGLPAMELATRKSFKFLFVGGTIARKGFDVLLNAWKEAFGPDDDVCLVVKDIGGKSFYKGQTGADWIREMQASGRCAEIEYIDTEMQPSQLPGLYAACDVLVHPYRGEGFGLPIAEAMACGLPCVVTRGGAADDFCTDAESWGVSARRVPVPGGKVGPFETVAEPWWLEPSIPDLVDKLRQAFLDKAARSRKGAAARGKIALHFTWEKSSEIAQSRLREIAEKNTRRHRSDSVTGSSFSKLAAKAGIKTESVAVAIDPNAESSPQLEELNRLLFKAEAAAARGDIPEAERFTEDAVEKHPDQHLAWLARAMVLRGLGKYRKAIEAIDRCLQLDPVPDALLEAFQIHMLAGENGPAKRIEKILKDKHPAWLKSTREGFRSRGQAWPLDATKSTKSVAKSPAPPRKGKR